MLNLLTNSKNKQIKFKIRFIQIRFFFFGKQHNIYYEHHNF